MGVDEIISSSSSGRGGGSVAFQMGKIVWNVVFELAIARFRPVSYVCRDVDDRGRF